VIYRFADLELDREHFELRRAGVPVHLEPRVLDLLVYLVANRDRLVTKDELLEEVWSGQIVTESSLTRCVSQAREAIGESGRDGLIRTVHGRGYHFHGEVVEDAGPPVKQVSGLESHAAAPAGEAAGGDRVGWPVAAVVLAAVAGLLAWVLLGGGPTRTAVEDVESAPIRSLAVLPLENLSGDPDNEYFVDGMTEALIADLARIESLRVVSRTTALLYKGSDLSLPAIARELDVDGVIEGSVFRQDPRVRISVQLIDARRDAHLWADTFERDLADQLQVQGDVARAVAAAIEVELSPAEEKRLAAARPVDPEAHDAYLRGRLHQNASSLPDALQAVEYYRKAIELDPEHALAHDALAGVHMLLGWGLRHLPAKEAVSIARAEAEIALRLDPSIAASHVTVGQILGLHDWRFAEAEAEFLRALELAPKNDPHPVREYGLYLMMMGRHEEGLRHLERTLQLEAAGRQSYERAVYAIGLQYARRYEEASEQALAAIEVDPDVWWPHWTLSVCYRHLGREAEAHASRLETHRLQRGEGELSRLDEAYEEGGLAGYTRLEMELDQELAAKGEMLLDTVQMAVGSAILGRHDEAFSWLERAYEERNLTLVQSLATSPDFDVLRSDPRYADLLRRIGYPQDATTRVLQPGIGAPATGE
jgi:TolB-like protein/DNA-binding winged helix-turn-helix (wHTH) protein/Tfp pilus assembly protein PilF